MAPARRLNESEDSARIKKVAEAAARSFVDEARKIHKDGHRCAIYAYRAPAAAQTDFKIKLVSKAALLENGDLDVAQLVDEYNPALEVVVCAYDGAVQVSYIGIANVGTEARPRTHNLFVARESDCSH